jgi:hypothetical protein
MSLCGLSEEEQVALAIAASLEESQAALTATDVRNDATSHSDDVDRI